MKRLIAMLAALLLLALPAMAEEEDRQPMANAAYLAVILEGAPYTSIQPDSRTIGECSVVRFTVLDLDGDGIQEVVLEVTEPEGFIILTCHTDGMVYGGEMSYRGMLQLKDDGTCSFSSGAMDGGVSRLCFATNMETGKPDAFGRFNLAESVSQADGTVRYTLDCGAQTTDEAGYHAFLEAQDAKLDALWYDYTQENLRLLLGQ